MASSTMTSKGQVTIPVEIRKQLGLSPGDRVTFRKSEDGIVIEPATSVVRRFAGSLNRFAGNNPDATIEDMDEAIAAGWAGEPFPGET